MYAGGGGGGRGGGIFASTEKSKSSDAPSRAPSNRQAPAAAPAPAAPPARSAMEEAMREPPKPDLKQMGIKATGDTKDMKALLEQLQASLGGSGSLPEIQVSGEEIDHEVPMTA